MANRDLVAPAKVFMSVLFACFFCARPGWRAHLPFSGRFLDDILGLWIGSWDDVREFVGFLSSRSEANGRQVQFNIEQCGDLVSLLFWMYIRTTHICAFACFQSFLLCCAALRYALL